MATLLATARQPDSITGLTLTALCWQMDPTVPGNALDALEMIGTAGYDGRINTKSDTNDPRTVPVLISAVIMSGEYLKSQNIVVTMDAKTSDWIFFDTERAWVLSDNDAQAGYTMEPWTPPPPVGE
jgi:hypothetical protein